MAPEQVSAAQARAREWKPQEPAPPAAPKAGIAPQ